MENFSRQLKKLRKIKGLTLDELAKELPSTKTTLSRYENNKRVPDAEFVVRIAEFFHVSTDYMLGTSIHPTHVEDLLSKKRLMVEGLTDDQLMELGHVIDKMKDMNKAINIRKVK